MTYFHKHKALSGELDDLGQNSRKGELRVSTLGNSDH